MVHEKTIPVETAESPLASLLKNYTNYNYWTAATLVSWLKTKPADLLQQDVPSSFRSIYLTLVHIWQTERFWLSILKKETPQRFSAFTGTIHELFTNLLTVSGELASFVNQQTGDSLQQKTLIEMPWFKSNFSNYEYIMHAVNHTTYHRGQVITIGRTLGFTDAPMTDYNFYNVDGKEL